MTLGLVDGGTKKQKSALKGVELLEWINLLDLLADYLESSQARLQAMFWAAPLCEGALQQDEAIFVTSI